MKSMCHGGKILKKGAEADLYVKDWYGRRVVVKERVVKSYRVSELDQRIRRSRTTHESRLLHKAKSAGVLTPTVLFVDLSKTTIVMEFLEGRVLKDMLPKMKGSERASLFRKIGASIAHLHKKHIIHGDLTTSNILVMPENSIYFIDFGLATVSPKLEDKAVDLHLMKTVLRSTHHRFAEECFDSLIRGYGRVLGKGRAMELKKRVAEIEKRGRYTQVQ